MPAFAYTALDAAGQQVSGSMSVSSRAEAYRKLEAQRLTPIKVAEDGSAASAKAASKAEAGDNLPPPVLKRSQLILFTEELADLLDGGLQLEQALRVMHERQESPVLRRVSGRIRDQVREGMMFSKALQQASPSFDEMYCNLTAAGEVSGSLPPILRRLSASITQMHELQAKVLSALLYPAFLMGAIVVLLVVVSLVLVPAFSDMLAQSRAKLPFMMQALVSFNSFFAHWWWLILTILTTGTLLFRGFIAKESGRMWWDRAKLRIPLFGPVLAARFYAQFAASLGNLINNGVPLLNALKLTTKSTANVFMRKQLADATLVLGEGVSLSGALRKGGQLPVLLVDMIAMGEQTGRLGKSLEKIAIRFDKDLDAKVKRVTALITPIVLVFLFVIVGAVALAVVSAIFDTMSNVRSHA
jgi:general secretion pathway protein F/type IV pilus assembly protein PilC